MNIFSRPVLRVMGPALCLAALAGCDGAVDFGGSPEGGSAFTKPKLRSFRVGTAKARLSALCYQSKRNVVDDFFFTRPPYDLWGPFRVELTTGLFDARRMDVGDAIFGLELDARGPAPLEFYGIYGSYHTSPTAGMQVFVASHTGNHGQTFFAGETAVDLRIEHDGANLQFSARPFGSSGAYTSIATLAVATPTAPLQAGFGTFGQDGGMVCFTQFQIPSNSAAPSPVGDQHAALNLFYEACLLFLEASNAMNGENPDPVTAEARLIAGLAKLALARTAIDNLSLDGKTPREVALKNVDKIGKVATKALSAVQRKGVRAAKSVVKALTKKLFKPGALVTDAIIPTDLRNALPSGGLPY